MKWYNNRHHTPHPHAAFHAALAGHRHVIDWLMANDCCSDRLTLVGFAQGGHAEHLERFLSITHVFSSAAADRIISTSAAEGGSLGILGCLRARGVVFGRDHLFRGAAGGHVETFKWLLDNGALDALEREYRSLFLQSAVRGHDAMLLYLRHLHGSWDEEARNGAAMSGQLRTLQFLRSQGCPWDAETAKYASANNCPLTLRLALKNGCPLDERACLAVTECGNIEVFKMLVHEFNAPHTIGGCREAALKYGTSIVTYIDGIIAGGVVL